MSATTIRNFLLAASLCSASALASVGPTSAGVVPTGAAPNTDPSAAVQQQSAGFVQQNQQAGAGATPQGTGPAGTAVVGGVTPGTNAANAANAANTGNAKNDPAAVAAAAAAGTPPAAPAAPPTPPPPPPTYVSNIKRVAPDGSTTAPVTSVAAAPQPAGATAPERPRPDQSTLEVEPTPPADATPKSSPPRATPPKPPVANTAAAPTPAKPLPATKNANDAPPVGGGSGEAPDGYTFYLGIGIAMALLLFALFTYLRTQQNDTGRRSPG